MVIFVCECGKELQLRHDCKNDIFHFAHADDFAHADGNKTKEHDVTIENDYGCHILAVPKINANGNVSLQYMDVKG